MKRILFVFAFFMAVCMLKAATILTESFDGSTFPPTGWLNQSVSGTNVWNRQTDGLQPSCLTHSGAGMARFNSYSFSDGKSAVLVSPAIDLTTVGSKGVQVSFWMYRTSNWPANADNVSVLIGTDLVVANATALGTINRSTSLSPVESADGWYQYTFTIPVGFRGNTNYLFFKATSAFGSNMFLDDVLVKSVENNDASVNSISAPLAEISTGIANVKATIKNYGSLNLTAFRVNWSVNNVVQTPYVVSSTNIASGVASGELTIGTFNFLTSGPYTIKAWTTLPNGVTDEDLSNDQISKNISIIEYASIPYTQNFDNTWVNLYDTRDVPDKYWRNVIATGNTSWRRDDDGVSGSWDYSSNGSYTPSGANSTSHSARFHSYYTSASNYLLLYLNLSTSGEKILSFWYVNKSGTDKLTVSISTDGGSSFTILKTCGIAAVWTKQEVSLGTSTVSNAIIKINGDGDFGDTDIGFDGLNVRIASIDAGVESFVTPTATVSPSSQSISVKIKNYSITAITAAQIGWSVNEVVQTPVQYTNAGLLNGSVSAAITLGNFNFTKTGINNLKAWTYLPNGLSDDANFNDTLKYVVYVNGPLNLPYSENFDGATIPALPSGVTQTNNNSDTKLWVTSDNHPASGFNSMRISYDFTNAMDDWFFTPPLNLVAGMVCNVQFKYSGGMSITTEKLEVKWGSANSASGMTGGQIFNNSNIVSSSYQNGTGVFTPSLSGAYCIGFHGYSDAFEFNLYVDDISVTQDLGTDVEPISMDSSKKAFIFPNPVKDVLNIKNGDGFDAISITNSFGQVVWNGTPNALPLNTSKFAKGVYVVVLTKDGVQTKVKFIKE